MFTSVGSWVDACVPILAGSRVSSKTHLRISPASWVSMREISKLNGPPWCISYM